MALKKPEGTNYLFWAVGGLLLVALAVVLAYSAALPFEGCVGVVRVSGPIIAEDIPSSLLSDGQPGAESIVKELREADRRPDVKAVLLAVDSPGGSAVASKDIYDRIRAMNKTTVAHINEMAASGGYYVAAATDYVVAQPDSLVGNIGARATFYDFSGLFAKIGYNETVVKTGAMKDMGSQSRPATPEELEVMETIVNESFAQFRADVEAGRKGKLSMPEFEKILDARVMTGRQAKKIGLVDALGNREAAVKKAAELAGIASDEPRTCEISPGSGKGILSPFATETLSLLVQQATPKLQYR